MGINRKELKSKALQLLRKNFIMALIMSIILCFAGATVYQKAPKSLEADALQTTVEKNISTALGEIEAPTTPEAAQDLLDAAGISASYISMIGNAIAETLVFGIVLAAAAVSLLIKVYIGFPLTVGARGWFTDKARERGTGVKRLETGFTGGAYKNVVCVMFRRMLYIYLWGLLLIIPGVIKHYSYIFVPYLLADNPKLGGKRALELSAKMTDGCKMRLLLLDLSFMGWSILGFLLFTAGQVLVWPYINQTFAAAYAQICEHAIEKGMTNEAELCL